MPYTVSRQSVGNYPHWRRTFDENAEEREEAGSRGGHIFRNDADSGDVIVFLAWEELDGARDYFESEAVEEEVEEGELEEAPEVLYLEELGRPNH